MHFNRFVLFETNTSYKCKKFSLGLIAWAFCICCSAQCISHQQFWNKILYIDSAYVNGDQNAWLKTTIQLEKDYEKCGYDKDSVYAKILHRIGVIQYNLEMYDAALENTSNALRINTSGKKNVNIYYAARNYFQLAYIYYELNKWEKVILYNDSMINVASAFSDLQFYILIARLRSSSCYNYKGDYEKAVMEATLGINMKPVANTLRLVELYIERAKAYEMQKKLAAAEVDINEAILLLRTKKIDDYEKGDLNIWANAYSCKGNILADEKKCSESLKYFQDALLFRKRSDATDNIPWDYNSPGYVLMYKCGDLDRATNYFSMAAKIALEIKNRTLYAIVYSNIAEASFQKEDYQKALEQFQICLKSFVPNSILQDRLANPSHKDILSVDEKNELEIALDRKAKCLLYLYKNTNDNKYLKACIKTSLLNDSLINNLRYEETTEQSKLYWRNDTRGFFARSLEACYLDNDTDLFFFFMEKSRAVLLSDKVNELGAMNELPKNEQVILDKFRDDVAVQQQKLNALPSSSAAFKTQQYKFFQAQYKLEAYVKSLETRFKMYYQYKYANSVPAFKDFQAYLKNNNQSFVHYFFGDTVSYILVTTPASAKIIKLSGSGYSKNDIQKFLQFCANKQKLNIDYAAFLALSNTIYKSIFLPLELSNGRVVICSDNIIIPFEALCEDKAGTKFLLNNYIFSYVYSASFLLKQFPNPPAQGNFAGFAPVSFNTSLNVVKLTRAAEALGSSASFYTNDKLFTHENASKNNFFEYAPSYSIVNIFSHAWADTTDNEPVLYMQDSLIRLSELQRLMNPATRLVLLSACQTNVGKAATGEGIYSLARGFASAGIPSIAATLWEADEQTIYAVSEKFNQYLSEGMNKDEALQKAKLDFMKANSGEKLLPYFWANMILIGNADTISLETSGSYKYIIWVVTAIFAIGIIFLVLLRRKKNTVL